MSTRLQTTKIAAVILPLVVTLVLWAFSKTRFEGGWDFSLPQALSQITALIALQLFCMVMLISARSRLVERIYGGLDKAYHLHARLGKIAYALAVAHVVLLIPHLWPDTSRIAGLFWPDGFWPRTLGILSLYSMTFLIVLTALKSIGYQTWLTTHKWMTIPFALACIHGLAADSDIRAFWPLRDWMMFWIALGLIAGVYKVFFYARWGDYHTYRVDSHQEIGAGINELHLKPVGARMNYEPGQFAFISFRNHKKIPSEPHPFSVSSHNALSPLRFSYKAVGDYTRLLGHAEPGDLVDVYGPYGEFTAYELNAHPRQIWIAGGIGITPFLSMLAYETENCDVRSVWFYYAVKDEDEAVYHDEILARISSSDDHIHYVRHVSNREGFLTADRIAADTGGLTDQVILMCGPPVLTKNLAKQFIQHGVPRARIIFEDFNFR